MALGETIAEASIEKNKNIHSLDQTKEGVEEYLFVPDNRVLLVGRVATDASIAIEYSIATDEEIDEFTHTVTTPSILIPARRFPRERFAGWEMDDYRSYGSWVFGLTEFASEEVSHHVILTRSYRLGAGPSRDRIIEPSRFGNVANFCIESGIRPNVRYGKYDHLAFEDYVEHIKNVIAEEDTLKITQPLLWRRIAEGRDEPSPAVIRTNTKDRGGLTAVFKAAGVRSKVQMTKQEYIQMWLEYMIENGGQEPAIPQIDEWSKQGKSHSYTTIFKHFGGSEGFKQELRDAYQKLSVRETGTKIKEELESGEIPLSLFRGVQSGPEMAGRYRRYMAISALLPEMEQDTRVRMSIPQYNPKELKATIKKSNPNLSEQTIASITETSLAGTNGSF